MFFHFFRLDEEASKQATRQAGRQAREPGRQAREKKLPGKLENGTNSLKKWKTRWWFEIFFIFTAIWGNDPI